MRTRTFARTGLTVAAVAALAAMSVGPAVAQDQFDYGDMTVGFIQTGSESGWRAANTASFKETAEQLGVNLKFYDAQGKLENQVSAFHQFNQDPEVDVIILAALDVTGYDEVLQEAKENGKIVVLEDRRIDVADPSTVATYIGSDFNLEGQKAAMAMCDLLADSDNKKIVEITGQVGASAAIDRAAGFREYLDATPDCGIEIIDTQTGNWAVADSKAVMEAFLKNHEGEIAGVFGHNDEEAIGAVQAIEEAGLVPGEDIKVIGVDATAHGFEYLIPGKINALIECNPLLAPQVYEAALAAMNGKELPAWVPSQEGEFFAAQGADALNEILSTRKY